MAKKLKFDAGQLRDFASFYELVTVPDGYGGSTTGWSLVKSTRVMKRIKNNTQQSSLQSGSFDFYQVYEFTIRSGSVTPKKDMVIQSGGFLYKVKGIAPIEGLPRYTLVITETINEPGHDVWTIINAQPYNSDKPNVIVTG